MGSVPKDYRCPACGAIGKGGYSPDGVDVPMCCEDPEGNDCLSKLLMGTLSQNQILQMIKDRASAAKEPLATAASSHQDPGQSLTAGELDLPWDEFDAYRDIITYCDILPTKQLIPKIVISILLVHLPPPSNERLNSPFTEQCEHPEGV